MIVYILERLPKYLNSSEKFEELKINGHNEMYTKLKNTMLFHLFIIMDLTIKQTFN